MSEKKYFILRCSAYGAFAVLAAGSIISLTSGPSTAAGADSFNQNFDNKQMLVFPNWRPMFEEPTKAAPSPDGKTVQVEEVMTYAPAETLDEAIRVANLKEGPERRASLAALWRRYAPSAMYDLLVTRIEKRSLEEATLAAEILALGEATGEGKLVELLTSPDDRMADRSAFALAKTGAVATHAFGTVLKTGSGTAQYRAAWGLGQIGGPEAAALLSTQAQHPEVRMRLMVVEALGAMAPADRPGLLLAFGQDSHPAIRRRVAEIYALEPAAESLGFLQQMQTESAVDMRTAAVVALGQQPGGAVFVTPSLKDSVEAIRAEAARILADAGSSGDRQALMTDQDGVVRHAAFEALESRTDVPVAVFVAMLHDPEVEYRTRALDRVLRSPEAAQSPQEAASSVAAFLADSEGSTQLKSLSWLTSSKVLEPRMLLPLADTGVASAQKQAVDQLLAWNTPEANDVLANFAYVPDAALRQAVAARLGKNPAGWSLEALARVMKDPDEQVRRNALRALQSRPEDEAVMLLTRFLQDDSASLRKEAALTLGSRRDPRTAIALGQRASDTSEEVRQASVRALRLIGDDVAAGALVAYLHDSNQAMRVSALDALMKIRTPTALGFVGEVSQHPDSDLRREAIARLQAEGRTEGGKRSLAASNLTRFFADPSAELQVAAISATGSVAHGDAVQALAALAARPEPSTREVAVDALRRVRDNRAVQALELYRNDSEVAVRQGAYRGLAQVGGSQGYELLLKGLDDPSEGVRTTVIEQVADLRLGVSVPMLAERLKKADFPEQRAIIQALGKIRSPEAAQVLVELTAEPGALTPLMAKKALDTVLDFDPELFKKRVLEEEAASMPKQKRWGRPKM